jgi:catechol 2,3-dioxygenase-like lactoylglutathione lyase family enzyme
MLGRLHHVVLDCPAPAALAAFYSRLLGQPITYQSDDWVVVAANDTSSGLAFQLAPDHRPPTWPDPAVPQQFHLDVMVEDVASAGPVLPHPTAGLGSTHPRGWLSRSRGQEQAYPKATIACLRHRGDLRVRQWVYTLCAHCE